MKMEAVSQSNSNSYDLLPGSLHLYFCVKAMRIELEQREQEITAKCGLTISDALELSYYKRLLRFYESLPPETGIHGGLSILLHCQNPRSLDQAHELCRILDYLGPEMRAALEGGLPSSVLLRSSGRPSSRRHDALRALQLKIDTGRSWRAITEEICRCASSKHDRYCTEALRQSVIALKHFMCALGIDLPERCPRNAAENTVDLFTQ